MRRPLLIGALLAACGPSMPAPRAQPHAPVTAPRVPRVATLARVVPPVLPGTGPSDLAWSPDGRHVAVVDHDGALAVVEAATGAIVLAQRASHGGSGDRTIAWDARGARLVWDARGPAAPGIAIVVLDADDGAIRAIEGASDGPPALAAPRSGAIAWIESRHGSSTLFLHERGAARALSALEPSPGCGPAWTDSDALVACEGTRVVVRDRAGALTGAAVLPQPARTLAAAGGAIAALDRGGAVHLLDARDARSRAVIPAAERRPDGITLAHDGSRVAIWSRVDPAGRIAIHDAATGAELAREAPGEGPTSFAMPTSDGAQLIATAARGAVVVRALAPGAASVVVPASPTARIALSPDERSIAIAEPASLRVIDRATGDARSAVVAGASEPPLEGVWIVEDGGELAIVAADRSAVIAWSPGRRVVRAACRGRAEGAVAAPEGALRWIAVDEVCELRGGARTAPIGSLRPSPDGRAALDLLRALHVRDLATGAIRVALATEEGESPGCSSTHCALQVALAADARRVAVVRGPVLRVWDGRTGAVLARADVAPAPRALAISAAGDVVVLAEEPGVLRALDAGDLRALATADAPAASGPLRHALDPAGRWWAVAGDRELVILRADPRGRSRRARIEGRTRTLEPRPRERLVRHAEGPGEAAVELWSALDGVRLARLEVLGAGAIDEAGERGARCAAGALEVLALAGGAPRLAHRVPCQAPRALRFVADGRAIVIDDLDAVRVVRLRDGAYVELRVLRDPEEGAGALVASSDGRVEIPAFLAMPAIREGGLAGPRREAARGEDLLGELLAGL